MGRAAVASFHTTAGDGGATVFEIHPVPPSWNFLGVAVLLGGLFGAPALAVVLDPARRDPWSLGAAACGALILGLAIQAGRQAVSGRGRQRISIGSAGLEARSGTYAWRDITSIEILRPRPNEFAPQSMDRAAAVGRAMMGGHVLGASIALQQQAGAVRVAAHLRDRSKPALLATGLDAATAERLRQALLSATAAHAGDPMHCPASAHRA